MFSDIRDQNLVFPDFADRGNVSAIGATEGKLNASGATEEKLTATGATEEDSVTLLLSSFPHIRKTTHLGCSKIVHTAFFM